MVPNPDAILFPLWNSLVRSKKCFPGFGAIFTGADSLHVGACSLSRHEDGRRQRKWRRTLVPFCSLSGTLWFEAKNGSQVSAPFALAPTVFTSAETTGVDVKMVGASATGAETWEAFFA